MKTSTSLAALALCAGILTAALPGSAQTKPAPKAAAKPKASATAHKTTTRLGKHHRKTATPNTAAAKKSAPQKKN